MAYGIEIRRSNDALFLTSEMPNFVFVGRYTTSPLVIPGDAASPPLVFVRVLSASHPACAVAPAIPRFTGSGWEIGVGYYGREVHPTSVAPNREITSASLAAYVFQKREAVASGWGIGLYGDGGFSLAGDQKPLIIRRRVFIDDNTPSRRLSTTYPSGHGRSVSLGAMPDGHWAAAVALDNMIPRSFSQLRQLGRRLRDAQGYFVGGVPSHIYIDEANNRVTTHHGIWEGPEDSQDNQRQDYLPVMLIDTRLYD